MPDRDANLPELTDEDLRLKALGLFQVVIPDLEDRQASLEYEEGVKGDNYFYTWYAEIMPGEMSRPFAQIALHKSGVVFAYYNTLLLNK